MVLYFLMVRLSTTQNMTACRGQQRNSMKPLSVRTDPTRTEPTVKSAYINDERHDEHDQRQLQLRVSDVAQQHLLQLEQRNYS